MFDITDITDSFKSALLKGGNQIKPKMDSLDQGLIIDVHVIRECQAECCKRRIRMHNWREDAQNEKAGA